MNRFTQLDLELNYKRETGKKYNRLNTECIEWLENKIIDYSNKDREFDEFLIKVATLN
jgi:hypothetical protein